jgi:regulator of RNase E activity RraA
MLGHVEVNSGDIIFADETGILIIPESKKAVVLAKANEIRKLEDANRAKIS